MAGRNTLDEIASDLALWIDQMSTDIALAFAPARAPFAAQITEEQKLEYYRAKFFNPDGSPNLAGRNAEQARMGTEQFATTYKAVVKRYPELKVPPPEPIAVPEQWPGHPGPLAPPGGPPAPPGAPPGLPLGMLPGPGAGGPPLRGLPMPVPPVGPRPPMMPPPGVRPMASGGVVTQPTLALIGEAGPEAVVPLPDYQPAGSGDWTLGSPQEAQARPEPPPPPPTHEDISAYIRQAAIARQIDPDAALNVALHEGTNPQTGRFDDPAQEGVFPTGRSYWPYQLHYGGKGTPYEQWGGTAGLGNEFTAKTGYQPGDPAAWQAATDFALDTALQRGWYPTWYGAQPAGYANRPFYGLPRRK